MHIWGPYPERYQGTGNVQLPTANSLIINHSMAFDELPDAVVQLVVANLGLIDALSFSCTCRRFHHQAIGTCQLRQQQQQIPQLAAAASQRLQVAAGGGWRDELLLTGWQQQQITASEAVDTTQRSQGSGSGKAAGAEPDADVGLLQCGLGLGFTEATRSKGRMEQQAMVDFSGFFMPVPAVLDATTSFIIDGMTTAMVTGGNSSTTCISNEHAPCCSSLIPQQHADSNDRHHMQEQQRSEQVQQGHVTWHLPLCQKASLVDRMQLVKGHLPPQIVSRGLQSQRSSNRSTVVQQVPSRLLSNPVADILADCATDTTGWHQLCRYLVHWKRSETRQRQHKIMDSLKGAAVAADSAAALDKNTGPLHVLVLPPAVPAGSIADLRHPWPPVLHPGALNDQNHRGLTADHVLQSAVVGQESALVVRGPRAHDEETEKLILEGLPRSYKASLHHVDLSDVPLDDGSLSLWLPGCTQLKSLSLAGSQAAEATYRALVSLTGSQAAEATYRALGTWPPSTTLEPAPAMHPPEPRLHRGPIPPEAIARMGPRGLLLLPRQQLGASGMGDAGTDNRASTGPRLLNATPAAATARVGPRAMSVAPRQQLGASGMGDARTGNRASRGPRLLNARTKSVCKIARPPAAAASSLTVLDVSSCRSLQSEHAADPVFAAFKEAIAGAMQLKVLLACRINVDAALCPPVKEGPSNSAGAPAAADDDTSQVHRNSCTSLASQVLIDTPSLLETLGRLIELDISSATSLSADSLVSLVTACGSLKKLGVSGCKTLASEGGTAKLQAALLQLSQQCQQQQESCTAPDTSAATDTTAAATSVGGVVRLPQLTQLSVGWGWSAASISVMLQQAGCLTRLSAGLGACVTDSVLEVLATSCQHLQQLKLSLCPVSSRGVAAVLNRCRKLTSLQLQQCVGPFSMAEISESKQDNQPCWQLSTLQLDGPGTDCTDAQLLQLLGIRQQGLVAAAGPGSQKTNLSYLANLCLVQVRGLTDTFLHQLAAAGCHLRHLRLEECYSQARQLAAAASCGDRRSGSCSSSSTADFADQDARHSSSGRGLADTVAVSFSQAALLHLLRQSCSLSLRSLQVRHAVSPLTIDFVEKAVAASPLLQQLVLDACDLPDNGVFEFEPGTHAALQAVHVVRCQDLSDPLAEGGRHGSHTKEQSAVHAHSHLQMKEKLMVRGVQDAQDQPASAGWTRRRDKQLIVHLFPAGTSLHLPA